MTRDFPMTEEKIKKKRRRRLAIAIIAIVIAILLLALMYVTYGYIADDRFALGTTINGINCSGKTVEETVNVIEKKLLGKKVDIKQDEENLFSGDLASLGVNLNEDQIYAKINDVLQRQKENDFRFLQAVETIQLNDIYEVDEDVLRSLLTQYLTINTTQTANAYIDHDGTDYVIIPEQYGNEFDLDAFIATIEKGIDRCVSGEVRNLIISVTEDDFPKPTVLSTDESLIEQCKVFNEMSASIITYTFGGDVKETISKEQLIGFYKQTDDGFELDTDAVQIFVHELAEKYDTLKKNREFTTHDGETVTLDIVTYGYQISETGEYEQLVKDLESGGNIEREPVYYKEGYQRNGMDDICGTYVEVDISEQHVWFYKDYDLIVDADCVTGSVAKNKETYCGIFPLAYKTTDYMLTGQDYNTFVNYWMPFYGGQGLHDADGWRKSYGGSIYKTNGSHGCVNLPKYAAKAIYDDISAGVPIVVHK